MYKTPQQKLCFRRTRIAVINSLGAQIENGMLKAGPPWVLGPNLIIDHAGKEVDTQMSEYIHVCNNAILRPIPITMQLGTKGLKFLIAFFSGKWAASLFFLRIKSPKSASLILQVSIPPALTL